MNKVIEDIVEKRYWTTNEVAKCLSCKPSAIRFWCGYFNNEPAKRNRHGNRMFSLEEIHKIIYIHYLIFVERYTLEGVKLKLDGYVRLAKTEDKKLRGYRKLFGF